MMNRRRFLLGAALVLGLGGALGAALDKAGAGLVMSPTSGGGGGAPTGSCAESTAFFARVWALPATLDGSVGVSGHVKTYDDMICGLVSNGDWALMDAFWFTATNTVTGTNTAVANLNLKSSSFTLVPHGSPTFTANAGYTGVEGSATVYIDMSYNPSTNGVLYTAHTGSLSVWTLTNITSDDLAMGAYDGTTAGAVNPRSTSFGSIVFCPINTNPGSQTQGPGFGTAQGSFLCTRSSTSQADIYIGGTHVSSGVINLNDNGSIPNINSYLLALNANGTAQGNPNQIAAAHWGGSFDATHAGTFYTVVCAAITASHGSC